MNHSQRIVTMKPIALLISALSLAGCQSLDTYVSAPDAGDRILVPDIEGVLTQNGLAAEGTELLLARNEGRFSRCEDPVATTQSSADGAFSFEAITTKLTFTQTFTEIENEWTVCANIEGEPKLLWYDRHAGIKFEDITQRINCDLDQSGSSRRLACIPAG